MHLELPVMRSQRKHFHGLCEFFFEKNTYFKKSQAMLRDELNAQGNVPRPGPAPAFSDVEIVSIP